MKYLLILSTLILSIQANSQDIAKFRSLASCYRTYENGEWQEWSDWKEKNDIITFTSEVVKVHEQQEVSRFDVTDLIAEKSDDGGVTFMHYSVDDFGRECRVDLLSNDDGSFHLSIWYNEKFQVVHQLKPLGNIPNIYQKSKV